MSVTTDSANRRALVYNRLNRRNRIVGILRWAVPTLGLVVTTGLVVQIVIANIAESYGLSGVTYEDGTVVIADPRYAGLTGDGINYDVVAEAARVSMENSDLIDMDNATITTIDSDDYKMVARAGAANLDLGVEQVTVAGAMYTEDSDGVTGELYNSLIDWSGQKLVSEGPVNFDFEDGSGIASDALTYDAGDAVWQFGASTYSNPGDEAQEPVKITADRLLYQSEEGTARFDGNAVVEQLETTVYAESLLVHFAGGGTSSFEKIDAIGGVKVVDPEQTTTGDEGVYDPNAKVLNLSGNVSVVSETGTITSSQLSVDMNENVTEFSGSDGSRVHGNFDPPDADRAKIDADRMVNREADRRTEFSGNTVVSMAEQTVWTQRFIVHYADSENSEIESYEMLGAVRIRNPQQTATGDRGVYDPDTRLLRLTGNVQVTNDSGTVNAPELVVNLATNVSEFSSSGGGGGGGRVTGVFSPDSPPQ